MNTSSFDVIIVGLGAMGSAAVYHLARRGQRVLGLDRFAPPHTLGSSHGQTRIIREAYFEHPSYVPIIQRAYALWQKLEQESGKQLLMQTGGLMIGPPSGELVTGAEYSARRHRLPYERISADEVRRRHPALQPSEDMVAIWDPRAGILLPEACIESHLDLARKHGAALHFDEPAISWEGDGVGVSVTTETGQYRADRLLLSAGAWMPQMLSSLNLPLEIERQVLLWFEPASNPDRLSPERCPIYVWDYGQERHFYGFPYLGKGVKVARMHQGETTNPDSIRREVSKDDEEPVRNLLRRFMPDANGALRDSQVCMFTNTPDLNFLIDFHPQHQQALIASPCSGHGFKFASAIGEILADMLTKGKTAF
jgi:sarcosine oxidase